MSRKECKHWKESLTETSITIFSWYTGVIPPIPTTSFFVYYVSDGIVEQKGIGRFGILKVLDSIVEQKTPSKALNIPSATAWVALDLLKALAILSDQAFVQALFYSW